MTRQIAMREAYGEALVALAEECPEMVVLDADVSNSTRTIGFAKKYPSRFFNVGVSEANMVDVAGGMATCGLRPVVNTFALFLALKAGDQIRNIVSYNNLPVVLAGAYAGLSDSFDGASHQSITDIAIFRVMPNMTVLSPGDANDVRPAVEFALKRHGPTYIRLSRNPTPLISETAPTDVCRIRKLRDGKDLTIAVTGVPTFMAVEAAGRLADKGVAVDLLQVVAIKPMDEETLVESARKTGKVLAIEEHNILGGFGGAVAEALSRRAPARMSFVGIQDRFTESGPYMPLLEKYGISVDIIERKAMELLQEVQA